eukprot:671811-Rhodomonas_salina.3
MPAHTEASLLMWLFQLTYPLFRAHHSSRQQLGVSCAGRLCAPREVAGPAEAAREVRSPSVSADLRAEERRVRG